MGDVASFVRSMTSLPPSPSQVNNARIIVQEFSRVGLPINLGLAAVVNAKAESNLDASVVVNEADAGVKRGGYSVGLFQLYDFGHGAGMSVAQRQDPVTNTRKIIQEVFSAHGSELRARAMAGAGVAELAGLFARDIERPVNPSARAAERSALATAMLPWLSTLGGGFAVARTGYRIAKRTPVWVWPVVGLTVLGAGLLLFRRSQ